MANTSTKAKYWAFIAYEESLPSNWRDLLNQAGLQWARSPYHDRDVNADGSIKKPHWHFIVVWSGPTTLNAVSKITVDQLHSTQPIELVNPRGYYRYFTHEDNPEKEHYSSDDIIHGGGFDLSEYLSNTEIKDIIRELTNYIIDNNIIEYATAIECVRRDYSTMHLDTLISHTIHFKALCASLRHRC